MIKLLYDNDTQSADLERGGGNIVQTDLLDTAVLISLFTHRQALPTDQLPNNSDLRGGWWADPFADNENDPIGSRLWLLSRSKMTQATLNLAREYVAEALEWMVEDQIVARVVAIAEAQAPATLAFGAELYQPGEVAPRWRKIWAAHLNEL